MKKSKLPLLCLGLLCTSLVMSSCQQRNIVPSESEVIIGEAEYMIPDDEELDVSVNPNDARFNPSNVEQVDSILKGKKIYWLGSSVTYGAASDGFSMADYLDALTGTISKKEAVSGTTLLNDGLTQNTGAKSYVNRLINGQIFDVDEEIDAFICQISTNDCTNDRLNKRGRFTDDDKLELDDFDVATSLGAVEYIIAYVSSVWHCPIYFYSGSYFTNGSNKALRQNNNPLGSEYAKFVNQVKQIIDKWNEYIDYDVNIIDLYNDEDFNNEASDTYYSWATSDPIHPRKAGYLQWWTPYIRNCLEKDFAKRK